MTTGPRWGPRVMSYCHKIRYNFFVFDDLLRHTGQYIYNPFRVIHSPSANANDKGNITCRLATDLLLNF